MLDARTWRVDSPAGVWAVSVAGGVVVGCQVHDGPAESLAMAPACVTALADWFGGDLDALREVPVEADGTCFRRLVWRATADLPAGTTTSYAALARSVGKKPSAARAVGHALGANPVLIYIPCHRVLSASGALTGYVGGLARKRWLLGHEARHAGLFAVGGA